MLHDHDAGSVGRQDFEQRAKRFGSAGGCADHHDFFGGFEHRARAGAGKNGVGGKFRFDDAARAVGARRRAPAAAFTASQSMDGRFLQKLAGSPSGAWR